MSTRRTALVLGVTGMVGSALAQSLLDENWYVHGAARLSRAERAEGLRAAGVEVHRFDVTHDDPAMLPDVDVLFLEIWDPARRIAA